MKKTIAVVLLGIAAGLACANVDAATASSSSSVHTAMGTLNAVASTGNKDTTGDPILRVACSS